MSTVIQNIIQETEKNENFRTVLHTGAKTQVVVMCIPPGGEIGEEAHAHVEQILYVADGEGEAVLDGETHAVRAGDLLVVSPGTCHNVKVVGERPLKIATVYAPANHIDGRVHATKADADADTEDEEFGHRAA